MRCGLLAFIDSGRLVWSFVDLALCRSPELVLRSFRSAQANRALGGEVPWGVPGQAADRPCQHLRGVLRAVSSTTTGTAGTAARGHAAAVASGGAEAVGARNRGRLRRRDVLGRRRRADPRVGPSSVRADF